MNSASRSSGSPAFPRRVLVIAKRSAYERYLQDRPDPNLQRLVAAGSPLLERIRTAHDANRAALLKVLAVLEARRLPYRLAHTARRALAGGVDLVISVGGDGTLLTTSHAVRDQPVLAVNSAPQSSVGYFCAATADTFDERLADVLAGQVVPVPLTRIEVLRNDRPLPHLALNDVLFAHANPAASSRYRLTLGDETEEHTSSGVWISTAAGSTGAMHAAGGVRQPLRSADLQYRVREPYRKRDQALSLGGGILSEPLRIQSLLYDGAVFLDGHRLRYRVGYGDHVVLRPATHPLRLYHSVTFRTPGRT